LSYTRPEITPRSIAPYRPFALLLSRLSTRRVVRPIRPGAHSPGGGGGRIRTFELRRGQIYSLLPLTARPPLHPTRRAFWLSNQRVAKDKRAFPSANVARGRPPVSRKAAFADRGFNKKKGVESTAKPHDKRSRAPPRTRKRAQRVGDDLNNAVIAHIKRHDEKWQAWGPVPFRRQPQWRQSRGRPPQRPFDRQAIRQIPGG
jgi:hypothetical protein